MDVHVRFNKSEEYCYVFFPLEIKVMVVGIYVVLQVGILHYLQGWWFKNVIKFIQNRIMEVMVEVIWIDIYSIQGKLQTSRNVFKTYQSVINAHRTPVW